MSNDAWVEAVQKLENEIAALQVDREKIRIRLRWAYRLIVVAIAVPVLGFLTLASGRIPIVTPSLRVGPRNEPRLTVGSDGLHTEMVLRDPSGGSTFRVELDANVATSTLAGRGQKGRTGLIRSMVGDINGASIDVNQPYENGPAGTASLSSTEGITRLSLNGRGNSETVMESGSGGKSLLYAKAGTFRSELGVSTFGSNLTLSGLTPNQSLFSVDASEKYVKLDGGSSKAAARFSLAGGEYAIFTLENRSGTPPLVTTLLPGKAPEISKRTK